MFIFLKRYFWKALEVPAGNWLSGVVLGHQRSKLNSGAPHSSLFLTRQLLELGSLHWFIVTEMPGPGLYKFVKHQRVEYVQYVLGLEQTCSSVAE